jgi:hypothetical protein
MAAVQPIPDLRRWGVDSWLALAGLTGFGRSYPVADPGSSETLLISQDIHRRRY